jgi:hypothetical protein
MILIAESAVDLSHPLNYATHAPYLIARINSIFTLSFYSTENRGKIIMKHFVRTLTFLLSFSVVASDRSNFRRFKTLRERSKRGEIPYLEYKDGVSPQGSRKLLLVPVLAIAF